MNEVTSRFGPNLRPKHDNKVSGALAPPTQIRLDKIQNGRLSAIIHFHMADIWSTVLDG